MQLRSKALGGAVLALALVAGACGDDSDEDGSATPTTAGSSVTTTPATTGSAKTLNVKGVDYAFQGIPSKIAAGTVISFTNESKKEVHEIAVLRVNDGETRPKEVLLALPDEEAEKAGEFKGVAIALPGKPTVTPMGPVTLDQPGRYLFVCNIKTGADPAKYEEALNSPTEGPPDIPGGPEHYKQGMIAEATVS